LSIAPARIREIAQDIVDDLNDSAQPWAGMFTAKRSYWASYSICRDAALQADVSIFSQEWETEDRAQKRGNFDIRVAFQKKIDTTEIAAADAVLDLVCAVADLYKVGYTPIRDWSGSKAYRVGNFVLVDVTTWRCKKANTNQTPASGEYWETVDSIECIDKSHPSIYSPKQGDTRSVFMAAFDLQFSQNVSQ
jgi:hypothetical protein